MSALANTRKHTMAILKAHFLFIFAILSLTTSAMASSSSSQAVKGAYWPSWALDFPPSAIDTSFFTHIYYAFLLPNNVTFTFDITNPMALMLKNFTSTLHSKKSPVKTLFSVGGASEDPLTFSRMASNAQYRKNFIDSSIEVARKFDFDGVDLDWEFPKTPKDMQHLGLLLEEWRAEVEKEARATGRAPLLLAAATYFASDFFMGPAYRSYPVNSIAKNLDWINAMCYDYHGGWDTNLTGAHAALLDPKGNLSTSYGLQSWIRAGLPRSKLIMGLPLYGRTWKLKGPESDGVGAPAVDVGPGDSGVLTYSQVVMFNKENRAKVVYDITTVSAYSVAGTAWIGYDDPKSITVKIGFAQVLGLRGYFFWAVHGDYKWKMSKRASKLWIL